MSTLKQRILQATQARLSMEAVEWDDDGTHFSDIARVISEFRSEVKASDELAAEKLLHSEFGRVIFKHMGMKATLSIDNSNGVNAYIIVPAIDRNNPILHRFANLTTANRTVLDKLVKEEELYALVDRKEGRLGGILSEIDHPIYITRGMLFNNDKFSPREIAAVILHELGHAFSYYEGLSQYIRQNVILASNVAEFRDTSDAQTRLRIISRLKAEKLLPKEFDDSRVANAGDKYTTVVISMGQRMIAEDPNSIFHNSTTFESAADQFAIRKGAGLYLAKSLTKIYKQYNSGAFEYYFGLFVSVAISIMNVLLVAIGALHPAFFLISLISYMSALVRGAFNDALSSYDTPRDRLKRIRTEMIGRLKKQDLSDTVRKELVKTFDSLDELLKQNDQHYNANETLGKLIYDRLDSLFIRQKDAKKRQQALEDLLNNELYVSAARFA